MSQNSKISSTKISTIYVSPQAKNGKLWSLRYAGGSGKCFDFFDSQEDAIVEALNLLANIENGIIFLFDEGGRIFRRIEL